MKKPIYRIFIDFRYCNKTKSGRSVVKTHRLDTISLDTKEEDILKNDFVMNKFFRAINKSRESISFVITNIDVEGQHGETNDRF